MPLATPMPLPAPSPVVRDTFVRQQSDLVVPFLPDPSQRIGDFQVWVGVINYYELRDSNDQLDGNTPNAELTFTRDGTSPGDAFPVFLARATSVNGAPLQCVASPTTQVLALQGSFGMCPALPQSIVLGKTRVRLRVWFQVGRLAGRILLLPSTDHIDTLR